MNVTSETLLKPEALLQRSQRVFASEIDNELVMMSPSQENYFGLNPIARQIWTLLDEPMLYQTLITTLTTIYDAEHNQIKTDIEPFLSTMNQYGLINIISTEYGE